MSKAKQFAVIVVPYAVLSVIFSWLCVSVLFEVLIEQATVLAPISHIACTIPFVTWQKRKKHSFAVICVCVLACIWAVLVFAFTSSYLHH